MFHHRVEDYEKTILLKWYVLSFLAGSVNAGGFLAVERFVTHVTGFATLFGIDIANGKFDQALGILSVPLFFLIGSTVSAYLIDHRYLKGKRPHYDWVMLLVFLCLCTAALGGEYHFFGVFGRSLRLREDYFLLALLCLASGLQNAAITTSSGASVRTTHLTGLTTDLGIGIVRTWDSPKNSARRKKELKLNLFRAGTIASFILGSVAGAVLFLKVQYLGFLMPAALAFYAVIQARKEQHLPHANKDIFTTEGRTNHEN